MRNKLVLIIAGVLILNSTLSLADERESSFFGGISAGTNLPMITDEYVAMDDELPYKEVVFLSGEPVIFEGTIEIDKRDDVISDEIQGSYRETYTIEAENVALNATLEREIELETAFKQTEQNFRKQISRTSVVTDWEETVSINGVTYELSDYSFSKASGEDKTPGISYYDTVVTYRATYQTSEGDKVVVDMDSNIYGFNQPWAKIEKQMANMSVDYQGEDPWRMEIQIEPSVDAKKTIYYNQSRPYVTSFDGWFIQRLERESNLTYTILTNHPNLTNRQKQNSIAIETSNAIESLSIPKDLEFLAGHFAEADIKQLYSLEIFTETPHAGMEYQSMTRGEFIQALSLAMNLDISKYEEDRTMQIFDDVPANHPLYPYVMAAYDAKLTKGQGSVFGVYQPITREEAFVILIRVIGLERLGVTENPRTPFVDDGAISSWAKKEIMAGYNIGIITGDEQGNVNPNKQITKGEAAAFINRLINYLREEMVEEFRNA